MEAHHYQKWGILVKYLFDYKENSTTLYSLINPRSTRGFLKKGDKILVRKIVIEGVYDGMISLGVIILHEHGFVNVGLIKRAKIIEKEDDVKLEFDNALDRVLIRMEVLDIFGEYIEI